MNYDRRFKANGIERPAPAGDDQAIGVTSVYDAAKAPDPKSWLDLGEHERIFLVEDFYRQARIELPKLKVHAVIHAVVENQIASKLEPVLRAMERLGREGLSRHDAVHAVGSVVAEHLFDLMQPTTNDDAATRYNAAVERLTAATWRSGQN